MKLSASPLLLVSLFAFASCAYHPPRFADAPPVTEIADDAPIAMPSRRAFVEEVYVADAYIRRPVMQALDASPIPDAMDVNALDDVPRSSWFEPRALNLAGYRRNGPPAPPLRVAPEPPLADKASLVVVDARGLRYQLRVDPPDRPEMSTAAEAIASRLVWLFGLHTPEVWIERLGVGDFATTADASRAAAFFASGPPKNGDGRFRVSATRWPEGIDLGATIPYPPRRDDPNDRIPHAERRSLRALKILGAWLDLDRLGPAKTRESYVGSPSARSAGPGEANRGHTVHHVLGLKDSLGATRIVREPDGRGPSDTGPDPLLNLVTLGLAKDRAVVPTQRRFPALGAIDDWVVVASYRPSPPWDPIERALPADLYWAAKRIARIDRPLIVQAVAGGAISEAEARLLLIDAIDARRQAVVGQAYSGVTPVEVVKADGRRLVLRDEAIALAPRSVDPTAYAVQVTDERGAEIGAAQVPATSSTFAVDLPANVVVELPASVVKAGAYAIVRVLAVRGGASLPRSCAIHVIGTGTSVRVAGVRH